MVLNLFTLIVLSETHWKPSNHSNDHYTCKDVTNHNHDENDPQEGKMHHPIDRLLVSSVLVLLASNVSDVLTGKVLHLLTIAIFDFVAYSTLNFVAFKFTNRR